MKTPTRTTKILSLSIAPKLLREAERVAKIEGRTRSELFREALRRYIREQQWQGLQSYGASRAKSLDLTEADVPQLLKEYRKGKKR
jgi:CopG family transcriptional regulator / antitoxin EndoAI